MIQRITNVIIVLVVIASIVVVVHIALDADLDSAGREYTELPYRKYRVDGYPVWAFELYGLKCVAVRESLTCVDVGR